MKLKKVYGLTDNGIVFYIGQTFDLRNRLNGHITESKKSITRKDIRINEIINNGRKLDIVILVECPKKMALRLEVDQINMYRNNGFNLVNHNHVSKYGFNDTELIILQLIADDHISKGISEITGLSSRRIEVIRLDMKRKAKVKTIAGLIYYGFNNKLIK